MGSPRIRGDGEAESAKQVRMGEKQRGGRSLGRKEADGPSYKMALVGTVT